MVFGILQVSTLLLSTTPSCRQDSKGSGLYFSPPTAGTVRADNNNVTPNITKQHPCSYSLEALCQSLGASMGEQNLIQLSRIGGGGGGGSAAQVEDAVAPTDAAEETLPDAADSFYRGVTLTSAVQAEDIILSVPLDACLCDDTVPEWFASAINKGSGDEQEGKIDYDGDDNPCTDPNQWATRLAASLLDAHIKHVEGSAAAATNDKGSNPSLISGQAVWLEMLPDPKELRASLPVHWSEETVSRTRCCALELACDSAYFSRAEAVNKLLDGLQHLLNSSDDDDDDTSDKPGVAHTLRRLLQNSSGADVSGSDGTTTITDAPSSSQPQSPLYTEDLELVCHNMLDIVQTRTCRVKHDDGFGLPLRILAPIFDFINHGAGASANADFHLTENDALVVTARRGLQSGEEVLIDYGASARPGWRCLASYGFLPETSTTTALLQGADEAGDEEVGVEVEEDTAEIFMYGVRYEVTSTTIPVDMVEAATIAMHDEYRQENPHIADAFTISKFSTSLALFRVAQRLSDAAYDLVLHNDDEDEGSNGQEDYNDDDEADTTMGRFVAESLAASLRWSHHRVLLDCAKGLRAYASMQLEPAEEEAQ
jgi:hypothetical protein